MASLVASVSTIDQLARLGLGRERMLERQSADLLGKIDGMAARRRTEGTATATELRRTTRAVTSDAAALLLADFLRPV